MKNVIKILVILIFSIGFLAQCTRTLSLEEQLKNMEGIHYKSIIPDSTFTEAYEIMLSQPLDHWNRSAGSLEQKIVLQHAGFARPVVMITEGYALRRNYTRELSELLGANEIRVEHRYFGDSAPDSMQWEYLNVRQSAEDHHKIVYLFNNMYPGIWVNTGWSKGGQAAIFHRYYYPQDVDATVAYGAPLNFSDEDERIDQYFSLVESRDCRDRLKAFQRGALKKKDALLKLMAGFSRERDYRFSIGLEAALEYVILEYPFSFWQYHKVDCIDIPGNQATAREIFDHLLKIVSFSSYSDKAMNSTAMYQFYTELGYYGYVTDGLEKWLSGAYDYSNGVFAPDEAKDKYNPKLMNKINDWLQSDGHQMIYIYGANDPWSATGVEISGQTDAFRFDLARGNHYTFIRSLPDEEREFILSRLKSWFKK